MTGLRLAGALMLGGVAFAIVWRATVAPAVLGEFDPADMAHRDRAFLSIGNAVSSILFAAALLAMSRANSAAFWRRVALWFGLGAAVAASASSVGLVWSESAAPLLTVGVLLGAAAWAISGYGTFTSARRALGWPAMATAVISVLAAAVILAGAHILFVATVALLPYAIALLVLPADRRASSSTQDLSAAVWTRTS